MALYYYTKEVNSERKRILTIASYVSMTIGALFLFWSFYPIVAFEIYSYLFINNKITDPIAKSASSSLAKAERIKGSNSTFSTNLVDFTKASAWFPESYSASTSHKRIDLKEYELSIPKLKIYNAKVEVGGDDLLSGLVDYLPENLPGEYGTKSIFGHSTLLQNYNPQDYSTIFSYVPTLENGDTITLRVGQVEYEYKVFDKFIIDPSEVSVLKQQYDHSYLNLITCTPPGTYFKRAVVRAKLAQLPQK